MFNTFKIELLKIKGLKLLLLACFFPVLSIIQGIGLVKNIGETKGFTDFWPSFFSGSTLLYGMFILPMLITILIAMIIRIEHSNNGWKQLLAMPIERRNVYLSKLLLVFMILFISVAVLIVGIIISGMVLGGTEPIPLKIVVLRPILALIAALPIIALQFYLSIRFKHIGVPLGVGALTILPIILIANSAKYWIFYPWTYPLLTIMPNSIISIDASRYGIMYGVSIISFILIIGIGLLQFKKKDII